MPLTLTHVWPVPPRNDPPLLEGGAEHSQAWARYFQGVSDELGAIAGTFTALRAERDALNTRVADLENRLSKMELEVLEVEDDLLERLTALAARVAALEGP